MTNGTVDTADLKAADLVIEAITAKLEANKPIIARSLRHGSLKWSYESMSKIDIRIEPRI